MNEPRYNDSSSFSAILLSLFLSFFSFTHLSQTLRSPSFQFLRYFLHSISYSWLISSSMRSILPRFFPMSKKERGGGSSNKAHVYLNVYDLTPVNNYLYWFGLGIFHSGIQVHGMEYGFGAHDYSSSGVFEVEPKNCPGFIYRGSVCLGKTNMSPSEFRDFLEHMSEKYHGDTYHLIAKNCNHFTDDVCMQLTGKSIPGWVNRLARLGSLCNCLLPQNIQIRTVAHLPDHHLHSDGSETFVEEEVDEELDHQLLTISKGADLTHQGNP